MRLNHTVTWMLVLAPWVVSCGGATTAQQSAHEVDAAVTYAGSGSPRPVDAGGTSVDVQPTEATVTSADGAASARPPEVTVPPPGDPGVAGSPYGPKMGGTVTFSAGLRTRISGFASAVSRDGTSRLFFVPDEPANVRTGHVYISMVLPLNEWVTGTYASGLVGAIEIITPDHTRFARDLATIDPTSAAFRFEITRALLADTADHYYLTGALHAEIQNAANSSDRAILDLGINVPIE